MSHSLLVSLHQTNFPEPKDCGNLTGLIYSGVLDQIPRLLIGGFRLEFSRNAIRHGIIAGSSGAPAMLGGLPSRISADRIGPCLSTRLNCIRLTDCTS